MRAKGRLITSLIVILSIIITFGCTNTDINPGSTNNGATVSGLPGMGGNVGYWTGDQNGPIEGNHVNFPASFKTFKYQDGTSEAYALPNEAQTYQQQFTVDGRKVVGGFGGDVTKSREENIASLNYRPVILIHGQGGRANGDDWGMAQIYTKLREGGYNPSAIWAVSYLGLYESTLYDGKNDPESAYTGQFYMYRRNVEEIRKFIKGVMAYLGVDKVDIIGHSLGVMLARLAIHGYTSNGTFDSSKKLTGKVGNVILLAGANYGIQNGGSASTWCEFKPTDNVYSGSEAEISQVNYYALAAQGGWIYLKTDTTTRPGYPANLQVNVIDPNNGAVTSTITDRSTSYLDGARENVRISYSESSDVYKHQAAVRWVDFPGTYHWAKQHLFNAPPDPKPVVSFNPNGARFQTGESVNVTLSATENATQIRYQITTDLAQNEPDANVWLTYTGAITITQTCKIFAQGLNDKGWGQVAESNPYDNRPVPVTTIHHAGGNFDGTLNVDITATNNPTEIQYQLAAEGAQAPDANAWTTVTGASAIAEVGKSGRLFARAKNSVDYGAYVYVDFVRNTPPISVQVKIEPQYIVLKKATIIVTSDEGTIQYKMDTKWFAGTWTNIANNGSFTAYSYSTTLYVKVTVGGVTKSFYLENVGNLADGTYDATEGEPSAS